MSVPKFVPRTTQLLGHSLAVIFALFTFIPLGQLYYKYDYRCILDAKLHVDVDVNGTSSVNIQGDGSLWGNTSLCHYTIFLAVFVAIHAFIWGWFTIHLIRTLKETGRELALYLPLFITHAIVCVCSFIASALLTSSSSRLCSDMTISPKDKFSCVDLEIMDWYSDVDDKLSLSPFPRLTVAQVSSWVMTIMVAVPCGVAIFQMFASAPLNYQVAPQSSTSGIDGPLTENEQSMAEDESYERSYPL